MIKPIKSVTLLIADDDAEDRMMLQEAFTENRLGNNLKFVEDGEQLMDYLNHRGAFENPEQNPRPGLILLDLNMPKKDGREVLKEIKSNPVFKDIPVIVLSTSKTEEDVIRSYNLGVNSFIAKPVTFESLVKIVRELGHYWFELVELPKKDENRQ